MLLFRSRRNTRLAFNNFIFFLLWLVFKFYFWKIVSGGKSENTPAQNISWYLKIELCGTFVVVKKVSMGFCSSKQLYMYEQSNNNHQKKRNSNSNSKNRLNVDIRSSWTNAKGALNTNWTHADIICYMIYTYTYGMYTFICNTKTSTAATTKTKEIENKKNENEK